MNKLIPLLTIFLPVVFGLVIWFVPIASRKLKLTIIALVLAAETALTVWTAVCGFESFTLWRMTNSLSVSFGFDGVSRIFAVVTVLVWLMTGIFSFEYMRKEEKENRFFAFYLMSEGALIGMIWSSNVMAMYLFYEILTFTALVLILHNQKRESIAAAAKYLFFSIGGAFLALFGMAVLASYTTSMDFSLGGTLDMLSAGGHEPLLLVASFCAILGFATKAGMFPMHSWLPAAHPVAPAPASAVLSAVITNAGILGIIRMIYYIIGADFLRGTWVQMTLISLAIGTIIMGSFLAYATSGLKKRLAYSTVSQMSYILLGLFMLSDAGLKAGLMHTVFHSVTKAALFLFAGAAIFYTGNTKTRELDGIGKRMPVMTAMYTLSALALVGIPPASGFISKWYLAESAMQSGISVIWWLAPLALIISAILTAAYLVPLAINGYYPGKQQTLERIKVSPLMLLPVAILALLALLLGVFAGSVTELVAACV